jgi:putative membrane protein
VSESSKRFSFIFVFLAGLVWSATHPKDYFTWFLEVFPALVAFAIFTLTYSRYRFTDMVYVLLLVECYVLFIGGHYTYAEVPLFNWIRDYFGHTRNNYDKLAHFTQGFIPAMVVRELFVRLHVIARKPWLPFIVVCVCVTISVLYEFLEWFVAVATGEAAEAFLGTQGYVWDTQSDMLMAMIGASMAMLTMAKWQDKQIEELMGFGLRKQ